MPDMTMCVFNKCPIGSDCHRLNAIPHDLWQSYSDFSSEYDAETKTCEYKIVRIAKKYKQKKENIDAIIS